MNKLIKEFLRWRGKGWFEIRNFFGILEVFDINKFEEKNVEVCWVCFLVIESFKS